MSKIFVALMVVTIAYTAQGRRRDQCGGKPDGNYPLDNSFLYYQCHMGHLFYRTCPAKQLFSASTRRCEPQNTDALMPPSYTPERTTKKTNTHPTPTRRPIDLTGSSDTCRGRPSGVPYPSYNSPVNRYYVCHGTVVVYKYCPDSQCLIKGVCGQCLDQCEGKPNGFYQSLDKPRPFYYNCHRGHLTYRACRPYEIFNASTRLCAPYEVLCERGDGPQPSVWGNGGCGSYVWCEGGFVVTRRRCPRHRPYFDCKRRACVGDNAVCGRCEN